MRPSFRRLLRFRGRGVDPSERALQRRIVAGGGSLRAGPLPETWKSRRNRALLARDEVDAAVAEVTAAGLVPHGDEPKNWDLTVALGEILEATSTGARVLEMGAARYSPLLTWLYQHGYRRLHGIDLEYEVPERRGPIRLEGMDLTRTTFESASFDAIACLSVVEHGIDVGAYFREARRLLRPGGVLVTSTDYWCEPVDTMGITAYGSPVRILDAAAVRLALDAAADAGFEVDGDVDLTCRDRVVHWQRTGLDFTFLVFTATAPREPEDGRR